MERQLASKELTKLYLPGLKSRRLSTDLTFQSEETTDLSILPIFLLIKRGEKKAEIMTWLKYCI